MARKERDGARGPDVLAGDAALLSAREALAGKDDNITLPRSTGLLLDTIEEAPNGRQGENRSVVIRVRGVVLLHPLQEEAKAHDEVEVIFPRGCTSEVFRHAAEHEQPAKDEHGDHKHEWHQPPPESWLAPPPSGGWRGRLEVLVLEQKRSLVLVHVERWRSTVFAVHRAEVDGD